MGNPLYNDFNNQDEITNIIQQAQNFKKSFKGNARQEVQKLLNNGTMSQSQFNRLIPIAQRIAAMMPKR
jgi:hypothetical protein